MCIAPAWTQRRSGPDRLPRASGSCARSERPRTETLLGLETADLKWAIRAQAQLRPHVILTFTAAGGKTRPVPLKHSRGVPVIDARASSIGDCGARLKLGREVSPQAIDAFGVPVVAESEPKVLRYAEIRSRDNRHVRPVKDVARQLF